MKPEPHAMNLSRQLDVHDIRVLERNEEDDDGFIRVELSFSSESPVNRWWGQEILDHSPDAVDLSRLNDGAAYLVNHDWDDQVGVVESARIGPDRRGLAVIRFSRSARGQEIAQDVIDGIRSLVSVGYEINRMELESSGEDQADVYRITRWTPFEISTVSVPADPSVGVGRAFEDRFGGEAEQTLALRSLTGATNFKREEKTMSDEVTAPAAEPAVDIQAERSAAAEAERARVSRIMQLGAKYDMAEEAERAVARGTDLNDFRDEIFSEVENRTQTPPSKIDMPESDKRRYSLLNAIRAAQSGDWSKAGVELEASRAVAKQLGRDARGFFVPHDMQVREIEGIQKRSQNVTTPADGGYLVAKNLDAASFIELLYAQSALIGFGARTLTGLVGNVDIPRRTAGATFNWVDEDVDGTLVDSAFDLVQMTPHTITGAVPITRRALIQTTPDIEGLVWSDLSTGAALAIDLAGLQGAAGGDNPVGIVATGSVNTATVSSAGDPTYEELVAFETAVDTDNALMGSLAYVTTPAVKGNLRTKTVDDGSGMFLIDKLGYPLRTTSQLAANRIIFGNFSDVLIGMWGVLDLVVDRATKVASGGLVLRVFQDVDVAVRHPESFCINA